MPVHDSPSLTNLAKTEVKWQKSQFSDISPDWKRSALDEEESKDVTGIWKKIRENIFLSFCAYTKKKPGQEHLTRHTIVSIFHGAQA
ncbi:uncharacterized protein LOC143788707 isoform X2 [Ranitomeya variabilis]|uniref:uncharacterized protein LOC143788707 isoform X2 n=1 Tax=Ranitomeya variabilis TaxID=490064 RepID=UPI00405634AD